MKILIDFEQEGLENIELSRVTQFVLGASFQTLEGLSSNMRYSVVGDANELLGVVEALRNDVEDRKKTPLFLGTKKPSDDSPSEGSG